MTETLRARRGPFKELSRAVRLALYHWRNGPGFDYHGVRIALPDHVPFTFKRQLMQGVYEEPERRLIDRYLDPALPVIELGGSLGVVSAYVGSRLLPDTPYRIVEANPAVVGICRANANASGRPRAPEVVNAAIAYGAASVPFDADPNVHISRLASGRGAMTVDVPATDLRTQVDAVAQGGRYTLIMDIEGAEFDVFSREPGTFAGCALAIVEFHPKSFSDRGESVDSFFALTRAAGMERIAIDGNTAAFRAAARA